MANSVIDIVSGLVKRHSIFHSSLFIYAYIQMESDNSDFIVKVVNGLVSGTVRDLLLQKFIVDTPLL